MDHVEDVERLFSWLKAPMVHYREFAPQREVAEAVATWPIAHRAAVQTGIAAGDEPAPQGSTAARERIARDSRSLPTAVQAIEQNPPPGAEAAAAPGEQAARVEHAAIAAEAEPRAAAQPAPDAAEPIIAGFEEPPAAWTEPQDGEQPEPARHYPAPDRGALFAGEYRGAEREARPGRRVADRQDRSLDAVFSRLSGPRDRLPDPRARARTSPGLGPVFGRLR
jgi:hypothetical protein